MTELDKQQSLMRRALEELRELRNKLADYQKAEHEPIAVIALGCRFPGGCHSPERLWRFLYEGKNSRTEVPSERWSLAKYFDDNLANPGKINSRYGSFLDDIAKFDADFFAITAREAEQMDPQQRLLLEISWQTFERAGIHPKQLRDSRTGVFIGCMTQEYSELIKDEREIDIHTGTGNAPSLLAGRLAYYYGLQGPTLVVDTACSSSLLAVHLAVKSLRSKETDMALVGGVNLQLSARAGITETQAMMLAQDGLCKTFDEKADGIGRGDGVGMVVLKRLTDALHDGDPVCAVIKGSATNHDGRSSGLTVPSEKAQELVLKAALADALLSPSQVGYVEAHGTGTALGDPIEVGALSSVLGDRSDDKPLYVGSLKTNFGHMEGAAGIAGFIKSVLMLQNKMLPPHLNFTTPSSHILWQKIPVKVVRNLTPWSVEEGQKRVAGVSAFGLSGTNVHVLLEQAPEPEVETQNTVPDYCLPLKLSANSSASLTALAAAYQGWFKEHDDSLESVCYQAAVSRSDLGKRAIIIETKKQQFEHALSALSQEQSFKGLYVSGQNQYKPKLAILFPGQGSQYPGMTRDLYQRWPVFKQVIDQCNEYLHDQLDISLYTLLFESTQQQLQQTCYAQPAIFAVDYALYRLWQSWGVEPEAVIGHSLGEYVGACVAGILSLEDALYLVVARAKIMQQAPQQGGMLSIATDYQRLTELVTDDLLNELDIAAINSQQHCVISGHNIVLDRLKQDLDRHGIHSILLPVSHAFHSRMMDSVLPALQQKLEKISFNKPVMTLISNVSGQVANEEMSTPAYWLQQCRQPVLFSESIQTLKQNNYTAFLECGAKPVLSPMLMAHAIPSDQIFASVRPNQANSILHCVAQMYVSGFNLDWQQVFITAPKGKRPVLPVYPFLGKRYWLPERALKPHPIEKAQVDIGQELIHPLLHKRLALADARTVYFESWLSPHQPAYLTQHQVFGQYIVPLAVLLEMLLAASQQLVKTRMPSLKNVHIEQALVLSSDTHAQVQIKAHQKPNDHYVLSIFSRIGDASWQRYLTAETCDPKQVVPLQKPFQSNAAEGHQEMSPDMLYQQFKDKDVVYGEMFKVLAHIKRSHNSALTQLKPVSAKSDYYLHPVVWDGCMQSAGIALGETEGSATWLPVAIDRIDFFQFNTEALQCSAQVSVSQSDSAKVNLILESSDAAVLQMQGVTFQPVSGQSLAALERQKLDSWLYQQEWQLLSEADIVSQPITQQILCVGTEIAELLVAKLKSEQVLPTHVRPVDLFNQRYWKNQKSAGLKSNQTLHIVYCAQDFVGEDESSACLGFLALIQVIEKLSLFAKVTVLTCNAAAIERKPVCPKQSAVIALMKTAALEFPQRQWFMLDIDDVNSIDQKLFTTALSGIENEQQLALHSNRCYAARLIPYSQNQSDQSVRIANDRTYLVTGGSGALGFAVVEFLIDNGATYIVVVGRNGLSAVAKQK